MFVDVFSSSALSRRRSLPSPALMSFSTPNGVSDAPHLNLHPNLLANGSASLLTKSYLSSPYTSALSFDKGLHDWSDVLGVPIAYKNAMFGKHLGMCSSNLYVPDHFIIDR